MYKTLFFSLFIFLAIACNPSRQNQSGDDELNPSNIGMGDTNDSGETNTENNAAPSVFSESTYSVLEDLDLTFAEGLAHNATSTTPIALPIKLDLYYPDTNNENRPVFMFIHGGGFKGGTKTKPEIVEMANFYASRGWVFASIDYRTVEELCGSRNTSPCESKLSNMSTEEIVAFYKGIAPQAWIENAIEGSENILNLLQAIAMYTAQRDAKAALRWIVANSNTYGINTDYITVGGASAGAITTVALGISNQEDFRDEIPADEDPTLATANIDETYTVKSLIYFWGSKVKLDVFELVYGLNRYDSSDPELFMAHGTAMDLVTPYEGSLELQNIYDSLGIYSQLATIVTPNGSPAGHGAWNGQLDGKGLNELTFDFLLERQELDLE